MPLEGSLQVPSHAIGLDFNVIDVFHPFRIHERVDIPLKKLNSAAQLSDVHGSFGIILTVSILKNHLVDFGSFLVSCDDLCFPLLVMRVVIGILLPEVGKCRGVSVVCIIGLFVAEQASEPGTDAEQRECAGVGRLLHEEKSVLCTVIELLNLLISLLRIENTGVGEHPAVVFGKEYANLTTEQMMDRYDEICTFCRMGDTTNCSSGNLTPAERTAYHEKMNPFLATRGIAMGKISALAGPAGDCIDVEQLSVMSKEEIHRISGETAFKEPDYLAESDDTRNIELDPMADMESVSGGLATEFSDHLSEQYEQFAVKYNDTTSKKLYASGFDRNLLYQNLDGTLISEDEAMEEMQRWHRPVFVSTGNHPEAAPVPIFMDKGIPYSGAEAIQAFKNCDLHREEQPPKFEPQTHLSGWQKFKMGFANFLESIPLLNINGDVFRDDDINAYEAEKDAFEMDMRRYEERQAARKLQDKADDLAAPGYDEMIQRKLFSAKPELLEKAKANKAAQAEAKQQAKGKKLADDQKALNDWAKEKGLSEDAVDMSFREKLQGTGLPLETQKSLLTLHHTLRDERRAQRIDLREHLDNNIEISGDRLRNYAADAITCYLTENLLNSEVRKIAENAAKNLDYVPKLSKELSELACLGADGDAQTAMKDKLAAQTAELRESDAMQSTHIDVREIKGMLLGQDKISATKRMMTRVNNNAQPAAGNFAPQHQVQHQAQHQAQNQQLPRGMK